MPATFDAPMTVASADNSRYLAGFSSALDSLSFRIGANNYKYAFSDKSPFCLLYTSTFRPASKALLNTAVISG